MNNNSIFKKFLILQTDDLNKWKGVLKPKVFKKLVIEVKKRDLMCDVKTYPFYMCRGTLMDEIVLNIKNGYYN